MDLREAGVGEAGAALVRAPDRRRVGAPRVGREVEDVAVAAGRQHDGVGRVPAELARHQVAHDDALGVPVRRPRGRASRSAVKTCTAPGPTIRESAE